MNRLKVITLALAIGLLATLQGCRASEQPTPESGYPEQFKFTAVAMFSGETIDFPADYEGRVVYLNFFFDG